MPGPAWPSADQILSTIAEVDRPYLWNRNGGVERAFGERVPQPDPAQQQAEPGLGDRLGDGRARPPMTEWFSAVTTKRAACGRRGEHRGRIQRLDHRHVDDRDRDPVLTEYP